MEKTFFSLSAKQLLAAALSILSLCTFMSSSAFANDEPLPKIQKHSDGLDINEGGTAYYDLATITVSGSKGQSVSKELSSNDSWLELARMHATSDGLYHFEVTYTLYLDEPVETIDSANGRDATSLRRDVRSHRESGNFRVNNGEMYTNTQASATNSKGVK